MDLTTTLIRWVVPFGIWPVFCFMCFISTLRVIKTKAIVRKLPKEGFPSDDGGAARVRFWKTEPLRIRETWKVKAWLTWGLTFMIGGLVVFGVCWFIL